MSMPIARGTCIAHLPRAGLGNMLLVWARALVFSRLNSLPLTVHGWSVPRLGPLLRRESRLRYYGHCFHVERGPLLRRLVDRMVLGVSAEPPIRALDPDGRRRVFLFRDIPHWSDYFGSFHAHRDLVKAALFGMVTAPHLERLRSLAQPVVGIHVRLGDFRALGAGESFAHVGGVRTPMDYFRAMLSRIRAVHGSELPATVFSDGTIAELRPLLDMPNVHLAPRHSDVVDLLLLASSRLVICSAGSTFGYWAGFLADAPMLLHPQHIHASIRTAAQNQRYFEGGVWPEEDWPALLCDNIRALPACGARSSRTSR